MRVQLQVSAQLSDLVHVDIIRASHVFCGAIVCVCLDVSHRPYGQCAVP